MHKRLFFILFACVGLLGLSLTQTTTADEVPIPHSVPVPDFKIPSGIHGKYDDILFVYEDFDENHAGYIEPTAGLITTGWGIYEDIIIPNTTIEGEMTWITNNALDGSAIRCAITGGQPYNGYYCSNTVAKLNGSLGDYPYEGMNWLEFELDFYVEGEIDCPLNRNSDLEAIEFVWQFSSPEKSFGFGILYASFEGRFYHWTYEGVWRPFEPDITLCLTGNEWHHVRFLTSMMDDKINYHAMILDGEQISLHNTQLDHFGPFVEWKDTFIGLGVQIDGTARKDDPSKAQPAALIIDNVTLTGLKVTFDSTIYVPVVVVGG